MTWRRFLPEPNNYHVTALTRCLANSYFDRTFTAEESVESAWAKLRGSLLHYAGRSFGWNELQAKMSFVLDSQTMTIVGHVDAYEPETATIYDLKTTRFVKWQDEKGFIPRENHIAQVQCYYTLLDQYGIPVNRLVLVYMDDQAIVAKQAPLGSRKQWMIERATALHRAVEKSEVPEPEVGSLCVYCPFIKLCPKSPEALRMKEDKNVRR
jgi:CRISPR/Cas system-associated exonuclease Cas4 (RecB family)